MFAVWLTRLTRGDVDPTDAKVFWAPTEANPSFGPAEQHYF